jgi:hypothetical protein
MDEGVEDEDQAEEGEDLDRAMAGEVETEAGIEVGGEVEARMKVN